MSLVEFEKHKVVKSFMEACDVYYTNLGGYHYSEDRSPCYYLNGMLTMFEIQQSKLESVLSLVNKYQYSSGERILKEVKELLKWLLKLDKVLGIKMDIDILL